MRSHRIAMRPRAADEIPTARAAIRNHCLECSGYDSGAVKRCQTVECWLYPYRLGRHKAPEAVETT